MDSVPATTPTAAILLIGDEILSGKVSDQNGPYLIKALRELGVALQEVRMISDSVGTIAACVRDLAGRYDYLFTSGGVGPTHDDNTLEGVARAFGVELVDNATIAHHVARIFADDLPKQATFMKMARVPDGTVLLQSAGLRWPLYTFRNVYILPGIPEIFRRQFDSIRERFLSTPFFLRTVFFRLGEGLLAPVISQACRLYPGAAFGSYPDLRQADYEVRITIESKEKAVVEEAYSWLMEQFGRETVFKVVDGTG